MWCVWMWAAHGRAKAPGERHRPPARRRGILRVREKQRLFIEDFAVAVGATHDDFLVLLRQDKAAQQAGSAHRQQVVQQHRHDAPLHREQVLLQGLGNDSVVFVLLQQEGCFDGFLGAHGPVELPGRCRNDGGNAEAAAAFVRDLTSLQLVQETLSEFTDDVVQQVFGDVTQTIPQTLVHQLRHQIMAEGHRIVDFWLVFSHGRAERAQAPRRRVLQGLVLLLSHLHCSVHIVFSV